MPRIPSTQTTGVLLSCVALALCASACRSRTETWGFVATLGNDTTSVERLTREGNRITSDAVGRSPLVVRRRWEATLAPDGTVQRWTLDTHIANAPPGERDLHHELALAGNTLRVVRQTGRDSSVRTFGRSYARAVPWNAFLYGTTELLLQAARGLTDTTKIGQYFFEGWSEGNFGFARVRRLDGGRIALRSTGLSGSGVAQLDEQGRMLSYSGEGTTYKQEVRRVAALPDLDALFARFAADEKARGVSRALSVRDTSRATIGSTRMEIDYSRPLARGRTLVGGLIPYDHVWRTGANAATQLTISSALRLGGVALERGSYTLWTLPARDGVQLIINRQTGQWGTGYQSSQDLARVPMQVDTLATPVEQFTIRVDTKESRLVMEWGTFQWSVPIAMR